MMLVYCRLPLIALPLFSNLLIIVVFAFNDTTTLAATEQKRNKNPGKENDCGKNENRPAD